MSEQIISSYGSKFGFIIDKASVKAVYSQIDAIKTRIENKLNATIRINKIIVAPDALAAAKSRISKSLNINVSIDKISVQNEALAKAKKRLEAAMKNAFKEAASTGIVFPINKFKVDATELRKQVQAAFTHGTVLSVHAVHHVGGGGGAGGGGAGAAASPPGGFFQRLGQQIRTAWTPGAPGTPHALSIGQSGLGYGLLAGMTGIVPGLAATAGINQLNAISEQMQSSKVALGTITKGRGQETFDWLRRTGNETGMNYREQLPMFSNYLAGSINKQGYDASLQSFKDISLYGMTHGATNESMKGATRALGQMWSKGKVYAEELDCRLAA